MQSRMLIHYYLIDLIHKELKAITGMEIKVYTFSICQETEWTFHLIIPQFIPVPWLDLMIQKEIPSLPPSPPRLLYRMTLGSF